MITNLNQLDLTKKFTSLKHQAISRNLNYFIDKYFKKAKCQCFSAPFDVRLSSFDAKEDKEILTVVQPDICVICDEKKLDKSGCLGSPDLIVEILTQDNTSKVMKDKFPLYEALGVKEYWIVGSVQNFVLVYYLNEAGKYIGTKPYSQEEIFNSVIFPELKVDLNKVFEV